jgi:DNA (cytosine-5)-methyltransferase 1
MYEAGASTGWIAKAFGVSRQSMWDVLRRRTQMRDRIEAIPRKPQTALRAKRKAGLERYRAKATRITRAQVRAVKARDRVCRMVLCGGFPCQDLSYAGKGAGLEGERSGLWSEYARLIRELRPRYVVVENVSALLARGLGRVLGDLAASGYDAEWDCIPASAFGAPHRRDRLWLVAYPSGDDGGPRGTRRPVASGAGQSEPVRALQVADPDSAGRSERRGTEPVRAQLTSPERSGETLADADSMARETGSAREGGRATVSEPGSVERVVRRRGRFGDAWLAEPDVGRVADGVPARVDRLRALGNALVPQIAEWIGRRIIAYEEEVRP